MSQRSIKMCPFFPDMACPQGKEFAQACRIRMEGDFDPMTDFKDFQIMDCAIKRAQESLQNSEKGNNKKNN